MQILNGELDYGKVASGANGGTEIMARLVASLDKALLKEFQIIVSRVENPLDDSKIRLYYCHDLPEESNKHLANGGWDKFHKLVFVSNWQMQAFINVYGIPWSKCIVLQNAIEPITTNNAKWEDPKIKLIYHSTPHRGLEILIPVFQKLCETFDNLELDVFSSFELYGWGQRDDEYKHLYEVCKKDKRIHYHGTKDNKTVREALWNSHIFAYPSIWPETSCLSLMEAMSAGNICVHSNYAALPETAANWTHMYHFHEDRNEHAKIFYTVLMNAIEDVKKSPTEISNRLKTQKSYADIFYSWNPNRRVQWVALLGLLANSIQQRSAPQQMFSYTSLPNQ